MHATQGHQGRGGQSAATERGRKTGAGAFIAVFMGRDRQGRATGSALASLNNFSVLWGVGAGFSCLAPGPGVTRAGEQCPGG